MGQLASLRALPSAAGDAALTPGSLPYNLTVGATSQPNQPQPKPLGDNPAPNLQPDSGSPSSVFNSNPQPRDPSQTKAHKLLNILQAGLQGALAGRATSEQAVIQSGGRRSAGAGMGFEAGYTLPWQRAAQQANLAQQQAQTDVLKSQAETVNVPGVGPMPGWLAKATAPAAIRANATENAADTRAGATTQAAQIGAGSRTQAAQIGADARIKAAQMGLGPIAQVPQELQQQFGLPAELPLRMLNQAESAANRPLTTVAGENDSYLVNRQTGEKKALGVGNRGAGAVNAGLVPVADPNNPGVVTYARKGAAVGQQSPQGAATGAAKTAAKSEVPTNVGNQKVAFSTAIQHADLLKSAISALGNGDEQTLNSLKNRFKAEFGVAGPITAEAISDAYGREVTSILSKGHMTDSEIGTVGKTLNVNRQSPQQSLAVIDAYRALAQSKMNMLQNQVNAATGKGGKGAGNDPLGIR
jgi:hypothetical protein